MLNLTNTIIFQLYLPEILLIANLFITIISSFLFSNIISTIYLRRIIILLAIFTNIEVLALYFNLFDVTIRLFYNMFYITFVSTVFKVIIIFFSTCVLLLLFTPYFSEEKWREILIIIQSCSLGYIISMSTSNLIIIYLSLELSAISIYVLVALGNSSTRYESSIKYFFSNSIMSVFALKAYGYFYSTFATVNVFEIALLSAFQLQLKTNISLLFYCFCLLSYHLFKVSAVPFHFWTADVYQNTIYVITCYLSTVPKIASFFHIYTIYSMFFVQYDFIKYILCSFGVLSLIFGTFAVFSQTNLIRVFAYSSISHTGIILIIMSFGNYLALFTALFYLVSYSIMTYIFFLALYSIRFLDDKQEIRDISDLYFCQSELFTLNLLSLSGIPPFLGFFSKFFCFELIINDGSYLLLILFIVSSILSCVYYLKLIHAISSSRSFAKHIVLKPNYTLKFLINFHFLLLCSIPILTIVSIFF